VVRDRGPEVESNILANRESSTENLRVFR
jgi:hypothetical protein